MRHDSHNVICVNVLCSSSSNCSSSRSSSIGIKCSYDCSSEISLLAQLVELLNTQSEGLCFKSLQWRLIYLLHWERDVAPW